METNYETVFVQEQLSKTWPNWKISRKLGKGSYGSVYEIERNDLGTRYTCALKVLHLEAESAGMKEGFTDPSATSAGIQDSPTVFLFDRISDTEIAEFVQGVSSEIDLMMQLKGLPNIVTIEDYAVLRGEHKCTILIRMEELEPLDSCLARRGGSMGREELIRLGADICTALISCEHKNILHRDIKPSNLFYSRETGYKLGDFGISRTMASIRDKASMSGIGTLQYMAPEIYQGRKYNNTADIYSLGIVLYILANNLVPPFCQGSSGQSASGLSASHLHDANMRRLRGEPLPGPCNADRMLSSVICTACNPVPEHRFQTAEAFRNALLSCLNRPDAQPAAKTPGGTGSGKRTRLYLVLAAALFVLILLGAALLGRTGAGTSGSSSVSSAQDTDDSAELQQTPSGEAETEEVTSDAAGADSRETADGRGNEEASAAFAENSDSPETDENTAIEWSDPNLRDAVLPQVQAQLGTDSAITLADARKIEKLDLADAGISDLTSLQHFAGLKELNLANNTVSDISALSGLTKLEVLNLENNLMSDLSALSGLVKLTRLDLNANNISDLSPLAGLTRLTMLDIRSNKISDISAVRDMSLMEELYMSENADLQDLSPVSDMPSLRYLSVKKTSVSQIDPVKKDRNLHNLIISWTDVSDISAVDSLPDLSYLDIRNCPVKDYGPANRVDSRKGSKVER